MTINLADNTPRIEYSVAQGVTQTTFAVPFEFFDDADLTVYVDGVEKTQGSDYTVTGGDGSTGEVSMSVTGGTGGSTIVLVRDIAIERTTDFTSNSINRAALNTQLDTIIGMIADLDDKASRTLQISDYEIAPTLSLPSVDARKGATLAFNESTGAVEVGPTIAATNTVANIASDISAVAANNANVSTVADNIVGVSGIAANLDEILLADDSAAAAAASATAAATSATSSSTSAAASSTSATSSANSATASAASAASSLASQTAAAASEAAAAASETAAATSETNAAASETAAASSQLAAAASEAAASNSATNSASSATAAAASEVNAAASESAAAISESNAAASESAAATSEANALSSQVAAETAATNAATSETNAAGSATAAASSASAAAGSATAASVSADAALAALDSFDDRYLGQKASDPTVDNDGNPLVAGALYYNTTDTIMKVYDGSLWVAAYASLSGAMFGANNLSDVADAAASRTNLGLGTAATTAATDYATAAQGTLADTAVQPNDSPSFVDITVSGTVDGRDVSVDGAKLDGIEAGATADQTASEILTELKTVDGSGSGLDADLLDGLDSTAFATAAQGVLAESALQSSGGTMTGRIVDYQTSQTTAAATTIDFSTANNFVVTMNQSTTLAFSNVAAGQSGVIFLKQDATGGRTFTLPLIAKAPLGGAAIVQETGANSVSIISYVVLDTSNVLINYIGNYA